MRVRDLDSIAWAGLLASVALAGGACAGGSEGALGQAHLSSDCPSQDLTCAAKGLDGPLAVGAAARIDVVLQFQGSATPPTRLVSSHPDVVAIDGSNARGVAEGSASLLIMLSDRDAVVDFLHVWVATPDSLAVELFSADGIDLGEAVGGAELVTGDDLLLAASLSARGQKLLGDPAATWTTDSDVVTLLQEPTAGRTRVVARQPGHATISIAASGLASALEVEVKP